MQSTLLKIISWLLPAAALLLLPLIGASLAGRDVHSLLAFPPRPVVGDPASFQWPIFLGMGLGVFLVVIPWLGRWVLTPKGTKLPKARFPAWAWVVLAWMAFWWVTAWTRIEVMEPLQRHTFLPLWLGLILFFNALCIRREGMAPMFQYPLRFLLLFPLSAVFWWFFEYLNRFVDNWSYVGVDSYPANEYFWMATLSFSTVLPAFISVQAWLLSFPRFREAYDALPPRPMFDGRGFHVLLLSVGLASLFGIGLWPQHLYPGLWLSPLLIMIGWQRLVHGRSLTHHAALGQWSPLISAALAALICGFFWELWNMWSLAKWEYHVPYVQRFHLFEMPILGYAGYLPFGWECLLVATWIFPLPKTLNTEHD